MDNLNHANIKNEMELDIKAEIDQELAIKENDCLPDYLEEEEYKNQNNFEENLKLKNKNSGLIISKGGKFEWSKETVLKLIQYWEENECLYNTKHFFYHNKFARLEAIETITTKMLDIEPNITDLEVKTKMNYLRSQYGRELLKIYESEKNYTGTEELYMPTAYWYKRLAFLKEFVNTKKQRLKSNVTDPIDESSISEMDEIQPTPPNRVYQQLHEEPTTTTSKRKKENQMFDLDDQPTTSATSKQRRESDQHFEDVNINNFLKSANDLLLQLTKAENPNDQCTESFIQLLKLNLRDITDPDLKDELCQKMILLLFEYKKKQRLLSSI